MSVRRITYVAGYLVRSPLANEDERRNSKAMVAAAVRVSTLSLMKILSRCLPIVRARAPIISAISLFRLP